MQGNSNQDFFRRFYPRIESHLYHSSLPAALSSLPKIDPLDFATEMLNLTTGKLYFGDLWAKSHLKLGEVYARLGDREKAIEQIEKFLGQWKDADPGSPEIGEARERLRALR